MIKTSLPGSVKVRRYLTPFKFEYLLKEKSLYMPSYAGFSDKLEGGITSKDYLRSTLELELLDSAMSRLGCMDGPEGFYKREEEAKEQSLRFKERKFETIFGEELSENLEAYLKNIRNWLYACCWHNYDQECYAMWEIYGKGKDRYAGTLLNLPAGSGFCIETTVEKIQENLVLSADYNFVLSEVDYINHLEESPFENPMAQFSSKARHFEFEKEIRLIAWPKRDGIIFSYKYGMSTTNDEKTISPKIKDLNSFISKVIFLLKCLMIWLKALLKRADQKG